jgi:F-type H+-transporting ATPase subunit O
MLAPSARSALASTSRRTTAAVAARRNASSLALKYSNALFSAAKSKSPQTVSKVQSELAAIQNSINSTPKVSEFITNPTLSATERQAGLEALMKEVGDKKEPVSELTKNFFSVLSENGRLNQTAGVIEGFNDLVAEYNGELTVTVSSAQPLPKDVQSKIEAALKQSQTAKAAKTLKIVNKVRRGNSLNTHYKNGCSL